MTKTLEAHDKLIKDIFEGSYKFEIPHYQRPYAWTTDQVTELFDDLVSAMHDNEGSQYFLGSIVLIKNYQEPNSLVVDGQQRLTTLTILFAVLRDIMPDADKKNIMTSFLSLGEKDGFHLKARKEDEVFFREKVQEPGGIAQLIKSDNELKDSRLHFRENAALLLAKARALPDADLDALWKFLANDCSLVVISTPDLEAAYRIFSVLNNRGLDLAPIDIIKAEVLGSIREKEGEAKSQEYAQKWSSIEKELGRDAFGDLLGYIRTIYTKKKQRATLVKEFKDNVPEYKKEPVDLINKVINPYAEVWKFVRYADYEANEQAKSDSINDTLSWLNLVDFKDWVPPALVYFKKFEGQSEKLAKFFQSLERLTYFLLVTKAGINERLKKYTKLIEEIEPESFDGNLAALKTLDLEDEEKLAFLTALNGDIFRNLPKARKALILRLDDLFTKDFTNDDSKKQKFNHLSLEHVLPQTPDPNSDWLKWFPDEDERDMWTHRLANLVPLHKRKNSAASNGEFPKKKEYYVTSPFALTRRVCSENDWTPQLLIERQKRFVGLFENHWNLTVASNDKAADAIAN